MKIVVTIAALKPEHGGPARTLPALCRALTKLGVQVEIITLAEEGRTLDTSLSKDLKVRAVSTRADRYHPQSWRKAFKRDLRDALSGRNDVLLYDLGLWLPSNHYSVEIAARMGKPIVVSPRGMLSREALKVSKWKKRFAWHLYQRRDLKRASVLHATSVAEENDLRQYKFSQPIAVVPNGVDVPLLPTERSMNHRMRTALFLSRLHPIKGLSDLITAWGRLRPKGWRLVVAGPDEEGHRLGMERLAASLGIQQDLTFTGAVDDQAKWDLLHQSDLFILPSYSESFGMAIAEALAAGVPVITTRATPWKEMQKAECGWWVDTGAEALAPVLLSATTKTREELGEMGRRGRRLVQENYSWENMAKKILPVFEWLVGEGPKPSAIIF